MNEVNEPMSKCSLNGIKAAYYKQRNVCNNRKITKYTRHVATEFVMPSLIIFGQFQHRLCAGLQCARANGRANACWARPFCLQHS